MTCTGWSRPEERHQIFSYYYQHDVIDVNGIASTSKGHIGAVSTQEEYLKYRWKKILFLVSSSILLLLISIYTIRLGATGLGYGDILSYLFFPDNSWNSTVIWSLRLPRIAGAILAGCALGLAGAVMQSILRNPLASPFTLGISNAAAFGASLGILYLNGGLMIGSVASYAQVNEPIIVTLSAFTFAIIATLFIVAMVKFTDSRPETIVLAGLAISSIFGACLAFMQYIADDISISAIVYWQFGSLSKVTWDDLIIMFILLLIASAYYFLKRWDYNAMEAGEDVARGLGVNISRTRTVGLVMSALLTATVVSMLGVIGFIGLVGPHIVKRIIGNDNRFALPGSMIMGAIVLLLAYVVGSYAFEIVIPVGIITSAIGGPLFLLILLRGYKR